MDELSTKTETGPDHDLRANLLNFYSDPNAPLATRKNAKAWKKLQEQLEKLRENRAASIAIEIPRDRQEIQNDHQ